MFCKLLIIISANFLYTKSYTPGNAFRTYYFMRHSTKIDPIVKKKIGLQTLSDKEALALIKKKNENLNQNELFCQ